MHSPCGWDEIVPDGVETLSSPRVAHGVSPGGWLGGCWGRDGSQAREGELEAQGSALFRPARVPPARPGTSVLPPRPEVPPGCATSCLPVAPAPISLGVWPAGRRPLLFRFSCQAAPVSEGPVQPTSFSRWEAGPFLGGCGELSGMKDAERRPLWAQSSGPRSTGSPRPLPGRPGRLASPVLRKPRGPTR